VSETIWGRMTGWLRNRKKPPVYAALRSRRTISFAPRRKPEITQLQSCTCFRTSNMILEHNTTGHYKTFTKTTRVEPPVAETIQPPYSKRTVVNAASSHGATALREPWPPVLFASTGLHPSIPISRRSSWTSSSHLSLGLALFLLV
jgi:hypothetical protein